MKPLAIIMCVVSFIAIRFIGQAVAEGVYDRSDAVLVFVGLLITLVLLQIKFPVIHSWLEGFVLLLGVVLCLAAILNLLEADVDFGTTQIFK